MIELYMFGLDSYQFDDVNVGSDHKAGNKILEKFMIIP